MVLLEGPVLAAEPGVDVVDPALADLLGGAECGAGSVLEHEEGDLGPLTGQVCFHELEDLPVLLRAPGQPLEVAAHQLHPLDLEDAFGDREDFGNVGEVLGLREEQLT